MHQFEIYDGDHADINADINASTLPESQELYEFRIADAARTQPLSNTFMLQYFHSRTRGRLGTDFEYIPRRRSHLQLDRLGRHGPEWGLHFVEGLSFFGILVVVAVGITASIILGIVVSVVFKDGSLGAGWGAFAAATLAVIVAVVALMSRA